MQKATQTATLLCISLLLMFAVNLQAAAQQENALVAPDTLWQENYEDSYTLNSAPLSNLIETSDGGYAFITVGYRHQGLHPSTLYKLNSTGNIQWIKRFESFIASTIIQTSDGGYEISGNWATYYETLNATIIKTDMNATTQCNQNYTNPPQQSINAAMLQNDSATSTIIKTSDGGYAYYGDYGTIIKTDENKQTQWTKKVTYCAQKAITLGSLTFPESSIPIWVRSMIETSDGALAIVGVIPKSNPYMCIPCLIKTEAFLPPPQQTPLPTPQPTPTPYQVSTLSYDWVPTILILLTGAVIVSLLIHRRHRKIRIEPSHNSH